ncbi:MAG: tetratricopeptide repeat protein [Gammaproteobacteria bacterium]|nr:tetratricopeptide repeat protein [Gammaproteobacteria bacterium]
MRLLALMLAGLLLTSAAWAERRKPIVSEERGILLSPGMAELMEQADTGDADAANIVGVQYEMALSVVENYGEAMKWYRKAAQLGSIAALFNIGSLYEGGIGVPRDMVEARRWYEQAAAKGYSAAEIHIKHLDESAPAVK